MPQNSKKSSKRVYTIKDVKAQIDKIMEINDSLDPDIPIRRQSPEIMEEIAKLKTMMTNCPKLDKSIENFASVLFSFAAED